MFLSFRKNKEIKYISVQIFSELEQKMNQFNSILLEIPENIVCLNLHSIRDVILGKALYTRKKIWK